MLIEHLLLGVIGVLSGFAVAGGTFALVVALTIIPRILAKSNTAEQVFRYENIIIAGGTVGNIVTVYTNLTIPLGSPLLILFGFCSGIQVGCLVMALSEIMNVFPIMFRRLKIKSGLAWVVSCMAAGKVVGGLWYFFQRMGH